jgi:hypothetical protein
MPAVVRDFAGALDAYIGCCGAAGATLAAVPQLAQKEPVNWLPQLVQNMESPNL